MVFRFTIQIIAFSCLLISCHSGNQQAHSTVDTTPVQLKEPTESVKIHRSPNEVLATLKLGNRNFVRSLSPSSTGYHAAYNYRDQILQTRLEQHPIACVLTCMDSRVPPEIIFDQGIGALFVIRIAGNIEDDDVLGSMEYAVAEKGVNVILVLGHRNCGAIGAAFGHVDTANKELVSLIQQVKKDIVPTDQPPYDASAKHNVMKTMEHIAAESKVIRDRLASGQLILTGALYDVGSGVVDWNTTNW